MLREAQRSRLSSYSSVVHRHCGDDSGRGAGVLEGQAGSSEEERSLVVSPRSPVGVIHEAIQFPAGPDDRSDAQHESCLRVHSDGGGLDVS